MDSSVTGLLTIVCQHTFHSHCLSKWEDGSCPVCRYSQNKQQDPDESLNECVVCGTSENLWICLICGNIGCGRYQSAHAASHFEETSHLYSLELETQRVWDYAGDGYVHRLIQNRSDGKLVELPAPNHGSSHSNFHQNNVLQTPQTVHSSDEKVKDDDIGLEYSYLLTSQLESQRFWLVNVNLYIYI